MATRACGVRAMPSTENPADTEVRTDLAVTEVVGEDPDVAVPAPRGGAKLLVLLALVGLIGLAGGIGEWSGTGWFGHRSWLYGDGQLYVLNLGPVPLSVSIDGRDAVVVAAENAELFDIVGGMSVVDVLDGNGEDIGQHEVFADHSDGFLKLTDHGCLVATDITRYYGGGGGAEDMNVVRSMDRQSRYWDTGSRNVIWPRKPFPKKLGAKEGTGIWVELVGCELLEELKYLQAYLHVRLQERVKKAMSPPARTR
jgi:hypothetical protein